MSKKLLSGAFEDFQEDILGSDKFVDVEKEVSGRIEEIEETENVMKMSDLASDIHREDLLIKDVEEGDANTPFTKDDIINRTENFKDHLIDQEAGLESFSKFFSGLNGKEIKRFISKNSMESLHSETDVYWKRFKENHAAKKMLYKQAFEAFYKDTDVGFFAKVISKFKTIKGEAKYFKDKGDKLRSTLTGKELNPEFTPGMFTDLLLNNAATISLNNFMMLVEEGKTNRDFIYGARASNGTVVGMNECLIAFGRCMQKGEIKDDITKDYASVVTFDPLAKPENQLGGFINALDEKDSKTYSSVNELLKDYDFISDIYLPHSQTLKDASIKVETFLKLFKARVIDAVGKGAGAALLTAPVLPFIGLMIISNPTIPAVAMGALLASLTGFYGKMAFGNKWAEKLNTKFGLEQFRMLLEVQNIYKDIYSSQIEMSKGFMN